MPWAASSVASVFMYRPPPLVTFESERFGSGSRTDMDAIRTKRPRPLALR